VTVNSSSAINQLHDGRHRPALHRGHRKAPADAQLPSEGPQRGQQLQRTPGHQCKHHDANGETACGHAADAQVIAGPQQQAKEAGKANQVAQRRATRRQTQVLAQHAQRWHAAQLRQRRQGKAKQQHQTDRPTLQRRPHRRLRQGGLDQ
jgi:hypothetical protein